MAHWFALLQSADAFLNAAWLLVAGAARLWWRRSQHAPRPTRALLALALVLVVLFPIISSADDVVEQTLACDLSPGLLSAAPPAILGSLPGPALPEFTGYRVNATPVEPRSFLASSATGIHSPPRG